MSELNKLRWQCRRGALELDIILLNYLENHFQAADLATQQCFVELLKQEDNVIMAYLLGSKPAEHLTLQALLAIISQQ